MTFRKIGLDKNSTGLVKDVLSNPRKSGNLYTKKKLLQDKIRSIVATTATEHFREKVALGTWSHKLKLKNLPFLSFQLHFSLFCQIKKIVSKSPFLESLLTTVSPKSHNNFRKPFSYLLDILIMIFAWLFLAVN